MSALVPENYSTLEPIAWLNDHAEMLRLAADLHKPYLLAWYFLGGSVVNFSDGRVFYFSAKPLGIGSIHRRTFYAMYGGYRAGFNFRILRPVKRRDVMDGLTEFQRAKVDPQLTRQRGYWYAVHGD